MPAWANGTVAQVVIAIGGGRETNFVYDMLTSIRVLLLLGPLSLV